jgi:hypothetical protein
VRVRDDAAAEPGVRCEHAVVAHPVNAWWRDERGELGKEPLGRQRQPQRSVARPLHPVEQPAVLTAGEAVKCERRSQEVRAEPLHRHRWRRSASHLIEGKRRAVAAAERAVTLAPDLADGFAARAVLRMEVQRDWTGAEADLTRAIKDAR